MELSKGFGTSGSGGLTWELAVDWELQEEQSGNIDIDVSSYNLQDYVLLLLKTYNVYNGNPSSSSSQRVTLSLSYSYKSGNTSYSSNSVSFGNMGVGGVRNNSLNLTSEAMCVFYIDTDEYQIKGFSAMSGINLISDIGRTVYYDGADHRAKISSVDKLTLTQTDFASEPTMKILPGARIQIYGLK